MSTQSPYLGWQAFAEQNDLTFKPSNFWLMRKAHVVGIYCGYQFRLETFTRPIVPGIHSIPLTHTRMTLQINNPTMISTEREEKVSSQPFDQEKMLNLLMPVKTQQIIKGKFFAYEQGREIIYERENLVGDINYLQVVLAALKQLLEVYPFVVKLGGEGISSLLPLAQRFNPLQHVAAQMVSDIAKETQKRLKGQISKILCSSCLVHYSAHQVTTPWTGWLTYYGCKICGRSREFINAAEYHLIAVLDNSSKIERSYQDTVIRVNWIIFRQLFDFDEVEIIQVSDEEVEHFAVQVGNDIDSDRHHRYPKMRCIVRCRYLSENTMRILQHTFGQIVFFS